MQMKIKRMQLEVGCTKFINIRAGQIGFADKNDNSVCLKPRYKYENEGATVYMHTRNHDELQDLCRKIGAMTKDEFIQHYKIGPNDLWEDDYIVYLDNKIEKALSTTGIRLPIEVEFCIKPGCYEYTSIKPTSQLPSDADIMPMRLEVGCTKFPNMGAGQIGFAAKRDDSVCLQPSYRYKNGDATGYIHTRDHDELRDLCRQIGAMTKDEFIQHHKIGPNDPWKNNYIAYLDKEIAKALLTTGIRLPIQVEFYTEPDCYKPTDRQHTKEFIERHGDILHDDK